MGTPACYGGGELAVEDKSSLTLLETDTRHTIKCFPAQACSWSHCRPGRGALAALGGVLSLFAARPLDILRFSPRDSPRAFTHCTYMCILIPQHQQLHYQVLMSHTAAPAHLLARSRFSKSHTLILSLVCVFNLAPSWAHVVLDKHIPPNMHSLHLHSPS